MLDAYVMGGTDRELVYRQHAQFVQDDQFWGHWAHKRTDAQGRIYDLSPEVILGHARGRAVDPARLRRVFRLRQLTRQVRPQGQIRLHNFGIYVDQSLWGQTIEVLISDETMRIEQAEHLLVSYPCVYDTRQRRITAVDETGRQPYRQAPMIQLMFWPWNSCVRCGVCRAIAGHHGSAVRVQRRKWVYLTDVPHDTSTAVQPSRGYTTKRSHTRRFPRYQRITSVAWKRREGGMVRPRAWAVLRLITNSNVVGCSTGRSAGLTPFRILST
jgi:hypothetical protein